MILGIVGHEAAKFTAETEARARAIIRHELGFKASISKVVSGACHLGGIDVWAIEEAKKLGIPTLEFPPANRSWETGYKPRNMQIAQASDKVLSLVVKVLPPDYVGMRFKICYHCKTTSHVKSGGCWTAHYAARLGKPFEIVEI
jgi:hypothetical protein